MKIKKVVKKILKYKNIKKEYLALLELLANQDKFSYYSKDERKGKYRVLIENLYYLLKYGECNKQYFLYHFDRKRNEIKKELYLNYPDFREVRNNGNFKLLENTFICILRNKYVFSNYLNGLNVDTPKILELINPKKLDLEKNIKGFCKSIYGEEGKGVFLLEIRNQEIYINNKKEDLKNLKNLMDEESFLQQEVIQHDEMKKLYPKSVNTLRVVTILKDKEVLVYNVIQKIGAYENTCDNWHLGGVIVGVDLSTGRLKADGLLTNGYGGKVKKHPNTNIKFENFEIPYFKEALQKAKELHKEFINIKSIGWDIAITNDGPIFIEGNDNWDFVMFQAYYGPQKESLDKLLNK